MKLYKINALHGAPKNGMSELSEYELLLQELTKDPIVKSGKMDRESLGLLENVLGLARCALRKKMRDIFEADLCSGWIEGGERSIWYFAVERGREKYSDRADEYGFETACYLHELAEFCGGWWIHRDGRHVFIPLAEWLKT